MHHTAENTAHTAAQVPSILAAMYAFHTGPKGWHDIAYNFLVDREGGVWEGRAGSLAGPVAADATGGSQGFDQLVCFIGDFTSVTPTPAALDAGNRTLAWLAQRYSIDTSAGAKVTFVSRGSNKWPAGAHVTTSTIAGHREMSTTACPGNAFYPYVRNQMQGAVQELRGRSAASAHHGCRDDRAADDHPAGDRTAHDRGADDYDAARDHHHAAHDHHDPAIDDDHDTRQPATSTRPAATTSTAPARGEAAPANKGGDGGLPAAIPIAAATAAAGGALLWLRQRAQRADDADDSSEST